MHGLKWPLDYVPSGELDMSRLIVDGISGKVRSTESAVRDNRQAGQHRREKDTKLQHSRPYRGTSCRHGMRRQRRRQPGNDGHADDDGDNAGFKPVSVPAANAIGQHRGLRRSLQWLGREGDVDFAYGHRYLTFDHHHLCRDPSIDSLGQLLHRCVRYLYH